MNAFFKLHMIREGQALKNILVDTLNFNKLIVLRHKDVHYRLCKM